MLTSDHTSETTPTSGSSSRVSIEELPLETGVYPAQVSIKAQIGHRFTLLINSTTTTL
jgi:hypothetical protein